MAIENLREIGNVLYEMRGDGMLYPVRRIRPDVAPSGVPAERPSLLNVGGIGDRLEFLNQTFNPVEAIGGAMRAGERMMSPEMGGYDRLAALGDMLSGVAGVAGPAAVARRVGAPAAAAIMEGLLGGSPATQAASDMARNFAADEAGSMPIPRAPFDMGRGIGDNGGPGGIGLLDTVDMPAGSDPRYLGAAPDRSGGSYPRYNPARGSTERMERLRTAAFDPEHPLASIFDNYIAKGRTLGGEDWYNTEELRDWFIGYLGPKRGDAEWRDYMMKIGATSTGAKVPQNIRFASFYRALGDDAPRVAALVNEQGITPAEAARSLGIEVPNMPEDFGYGHVKQRNQAGNIVNQAEGRWALQPPEDMKGAALTKWLQANPKVKGFFNDLLGNKENIAADMHFMRMLAMAEGGLDFLNQQAKLNTSQIADLRGAYGDAIEPYIRTRTVKGKPVTEVNLAKAAQDGVVSDASMFKSWPSAWADTPAATEYGAYEDMAREVAKRYDMTPAQFQAALWMGAGDITGLADESQGTFMELFRRSLDKRAKERGISRGEMLKDFIVNRAPLAITPAAPLGLLATQPEEEQY